MERVASTLADDVLDGLTRPFKELPSKHFYDDRGSELFEQITELPEYYATRTERALLGRHADAIVGDATELVELGAGSAAKTRVLLDTGRLTRFVPLDVSPTALDETLSAVYPQLEVQPVTGDFSTDLDRVPDRSGTRLVAFLGGTIGNFLPGARRAFLRGLAAHLCAGDRLLLGVQLITDLDAMEAAYDDSAGVTAAFNLNVLAVVNRELGADFEPSLFEHVAFFDADNEWIEMRLRARRAHTVRVDGLDLDVSFERGEELRTEISTKFTRERVDADFAAAGLLIDDWLQDTDGRCALALARAARRHRAA